MTRRSALEGIQLVALDLDGTLLPSDKILTACARRTIAGLRARGIHVVLATGKGWNLTAGYAAELELDTPLIALEGAVAGWRREDGGYRPLREHVVSRAVRADICAATRDLDLGFFYCHSSLRTRVHRRLEDRLPQIRMWDPFVDVDDHHLEHGEDDAFVIHIVGQPERVARAKERVDELDAQGVDVLHWEFWEGYDQLQIRPHSIGKHAALADVMTELGVAAAQTLACGDWLNDVEMLQLAGTAVAPSNAVPEVLAEADHVLPGTSDDDTVARFLEAELAQLD